MLSLGSVSQPSMDTMIISDQPYSNQIIRAIHDLRAMGLMRGGESTKPTLLGKMIALGGLEPRVSRLPKRLSDRIEGSVIRRSQESKLQV